MLKIIINVLYYYLSLLYFNFTEVHEEKTFSDHYVSFNAFTFFIQTFNDSFHAIYFESFIPNLSLYLHYTPIPHKNNLVQGDTQVVDSWLQDIANKPLFWHLDTEKPAPLATDTIQNNMHVTFNCETETIFPDITIINVNPVTNFRPEQAEILIIMSG